MQASGGCTRGSAYLREVWKHEARTSDGCSRHLVLVRATSVYHVGLAGEDARPGGVLSDHAVDHRVRNFILLGGPDDQVRLPLHEGTSSRSCDQDCEWLGRF